jgi:hypothetical protein
MDNGWIKLHRSILEWEWWDDQNTTRVFLWLLLKANHTNKRWRGVEVLRGQLITSLSGISAGTGISVRGVRTSLSRLKSTGELTSQTTSSATIVTICNYDTYNQADHLSDKPNDTRTDKQATSRRQASDKQVTTNKNVKKEKNERKEERKPRDEEGVVLLTDAEVQRLLDGWADGKKRYTERQLKLAVERLSTYIRGNGKRYKNHFAVLQGWVYDRIMDEPETQRQRVY